MRRAKPANTASDPYANGVYCNVHFVETTVFTRLIHEHLDDRAHRALQLALVLRPEQGRVIPGSGGLRKVRWAAGTGGKRGGLRVIYYWDVPRSTFYCVFAYRKNVQDDLTRSQVRSLRDLVEKEFG